MKKAIIWLLLIALLIAPTATIAEEKGEPEELSFQGIPWFSSPNDAVEALIDLGFIDKKSSHSKINIGAMTKEDRLGSCIYISETDPTTVSLMPFPDSIRAASVGTICEHKIRKSNKTIAGQDISSIELKFTRDQKDPKLVECFIIFNFGKKENSKLIDDALITRYGDPDFIENGESVWFGAQNTVIIHNEAMLVFATLDGLELANSFAVEEEQKEDTGF